MDTAIYDGTLRQAQLKMLAMLKVVEAICKKNGLDYWLEGGTLLGAVRHQGFIPWDDDLDVAMPRASFNHFLKVAMSELPPTMWLQTPKTDPGYFNLTVPLKIRDNNSRYIGKREVGLEAYHQGIYIDIFPYDKIPEQALTRRLYRLMAKKLLRLNYHKYSARYLYPGHYAKLYRLFSHCFPKEALEAGLNWIINRVNHSASNYLGYGYDCLDETYAPQEVFYPLQRIKFEDSEFNSPHQADVILKQQFGEYWKLPPKHKRGLKHCQKLIAHID
jgi:lipopolysaccharide cholinephosphotransferase